MDASRTRVRGQHSSRLLAEEGERHLGDRLGRWTSTYWRRRSRPACRRASPLTASVATRGDPQLRALDKHLLVLTTSAHWQPERSRSHAADRSGTFGAPALTPVRLSQASSSTTTTAPAATVATVAATTALEGAPAQQEVSQQQPPIYGRRGATAPAPPAATAAAASAAAVSAAVAAVSASSAVAAVAPRAPRAR